MSEQRRFCTFILDTRLFGIEVEKVREVIRYVEMTRVPLAPAVVGGLINLRGHIVTALDLRTRLGLSARPTEALPMNIVLEAEGGSVSLLVDEIAGVLTVAEDAFEPPPASLQGPSRSLIRGVYKLPGKLLLALDSERVVDITAEVASGEAEGIRSLVSSG
jgi:purine-binding chemotaxis protein CheW